MILDRNGLDERIIADGPQTRGRSTEPADFWTRWGSALHKGRRGGEEEKTCVCSCCVVDVAIFFKTFGVLFLLLLLLSGAAG